ncbi:hypothetical protein PV327_005948 [Microctonus hyperodae]|uniref:Uncharacterized protein n=1 Tax=Microctonus hyperodae TaxID=165561 RepID=A0AA39G2R8_MICHY|nr:hypothetical protein PV327_005948 [Microctonus hyperodae]
MHRNNRNVAIPPNNENVREGLINENNHQGINDGQTLQSKIIETFKKSWLTAIIGCILCILGICLLFLNEGKAASVAQSLNEALEDAVIITDPQKIPDEFENRLIHICGPIFIGEPLTEPDYGVVIESIKLKRRVQMYQWIEIEEERIYTGQIEPDNNYYYTTEWRDKLIDSDQFYIRTGHENPKEIPIKSQIQIADEVKIGKISLGHELKKKFNDFIEITSDQRPDRTDIKMHSGLYYHSTDLWNPRVGDIRILLSYAGKAGEIYSIVGKLVNKKIVPFITSRGDEILLQRKHNLTVERMFNLEHVHNYWRTWIIRLVGWLIILISTSCLANILKIFIENSSLLDSIIAIDSVAMSVSMSVSLLVIGVSWMWYRPFVAIFLAFAATAPFLYSAFFGCNNQQQRQRQNYRRF